MNSAIDTLKFHGCLDLALGVKPANALQLSGTKKTIVQERDVSYCFYPHFHPYVGQLTRRLLQESTAGLQAADTEYAPNGASLPDSIEVALGAAVSLSLPAGSQVVLLEDVQAHLPGGEAITLAASLQVTLAGVCIVKTPLPEGMRARLTDGMTGTPARNSKFRILPRTTAIAVGAAKVALPSGVSVTLYNGTSAQLVTGVNALLPDGALFYVHKETQVTLVRSTARPVLYADIFSPKSYAPTTLVRRPYPVKDLDFTSSGAYSVYNWELFFHVPMTIAIHLSKNQRFAEAQKWFHYLFDPTDDSDGPTPERFWKVRPFQYTDAKKIEEILVNLATGADPTLRKDTINNIAAWRETPFRPHLVARYRQQAYMYKTVMAYLDNLIAWGDSLFRQDTGEAIDEALNVYVLAANLLGPRPQAVPKKGAVRPQTYANLRGDLDKFGNAVREIEPEVPFDLMPFPPDSVADNGGVATLRSLGKTLYFCVPGNDKWLSYWDTVADRLFKIRNSLNIQGIFRQLALFEPPIDPALLARATAAGLDVSAIVNGLNQPLPLVRFQLLAQKAAEICQEVKGLGNNLLAAMEKEDGEAMALLRQKHERVVMEMVEHVKYAQLQEAVKTKEGLFKSLALAIQRYTYYELQLGKKQEDIDKAIPKWDDLDKESLGKMKCAANEPELEPRKIEVDIATDASAQAAQCLSGGKCLSKNEVRESLLLETAQLFSDTANILNVIGSCLHTIPKFQINVQPMGAGATTEFGGDHVGFGIEGLALSARAVAERLSFEARRANRMDSFARRELDWTFQSNLAAGEITQIFKQLRAAEIREAIAELELKNHRQQMKHAEEIERFLNEEGTEKTGKKTNKAFYTWMKREVKGIYAQCFQFAFDIAQKAERALQHELGASDLNYLQFGYLAGKEGLLAGDKLYLDIKRMETAYLELNQREYEMIKHVSLRESDPVALIQLRATGSCTVRLPEWLFDMDGPGHYFRRIKNVAVSIPCVTGPYTSVNCMLTLLKSSIRTKPVAGDSYPRTDAEDDRFSDYFGSLQSIVTSSGQNDAGLFETNLRDERYLPFEYSGVVSEWQLQLPANPSKNEPRQFDYGTISDVILHLRYTAREGGALLRKGALDHLKTLIADAQVGGMARLFSARHDFPGEWQRFEKNGGTLSATVKRSHFPYFVHGKTINIVSVQLCAIRGGALEYTAPTPNPMPTLDTNDEFILSLGAGDVPARDKESDIFIILTYCAES